MHIQKVWIWNKPLGYHLQCHNVQLWLRQPLYVFSLCQLFHQGNNISIIFISNWQKVIRIKPKRNCTMAWKYLPILDNKNITNSSCKFYWDIWSARCILELFKVTVQLFNSALCSSINEWRYTCLCKQSPSIM